MAFELNISSKKTFVVALLSIAAGIGHAMDIKEVTTQCKKAECYIDLKYDLKGQPWPKFFQEVEGNTLNIGFTSTQVLPLSAGSISIGSAPFNSLSIGSKESSQGSLTQLSLTLNTVAQKANLKKVGKDVLRFSIVGVKDIKPAIWVLSKAVAQNKVESAKAEPVKPKENVAKQVEKPVVKPTAKVESKVEPKTAKPEIASSKPVTQVKVPTETNTTSEGTSVSSAKDLKEFVDLKKAQSGDISSSKTFTLKSVSRSVYVTVDAADLYARPSKKSNKLQKLNFGMELRRLDVQDEFYKVETDRLKGYVLRSDVAYDDELTKEQRDELMELAKQMIQKRKDIVGIDTTQNNATFTAAWKSTQRLHYSSFGRRDPFIPLRNVEVDGISIDEIRIVGIIWDKVSPLVILEDVRVEGVSYTLREGDPIINGKVYKINPKEVIFQVTEFGVTRNFSIPLPSTEDKDKK